MLRNTHLEPNAPIPNSTKLQRLITYAHECQKTDCLLYHWSLLIWGRAASTFSRLSMHVHFLLILISPIRHLWTIAASLNLQSSNVNNAVDVWMSSSWRHVWAACVRLSRRFWLHAAFWREFVNYPSAGSFLGLHVVSYLVPNEERNKSGQEQTYHFKSGECNNNLL